jgi:hypothetical protein
MSYVIAVPEMMAAAATDVAAVGSTLSAAHMAATAPTVAVTPAAADEVSASIAHLFSRYAAGYQALAGQAAAFHEQFVQNLAASAHSYAATETTNASLLQPLNAAAGTSTSTVLGQILHELPGQILNFVTGLIQQFLNAIGTAPPQTLLRDAFFILLLPILVPAEVLVYGLLDLVFATTTPVF